MKHLSLAAAVRIEFNLPADHPVKVTYLTSRNGLLNYSYIFVDPKDNMEYVGTVQTTNLMAKLTEVAENGRD